MALNRRPSWRDPDATRSEDFAQYLERRFPEGKPGKGTKLPEWNPIEEAKGFPETPLEDVPLDTRRKSVLSREKPRSPVDTELDAGAMREVMRAIQREPELARHLPELIRQARDVETLPPGITKKTLAGPMEDNLVTALARKQMEGKGKEVSFTPRKQGEAPKAPPSKTMDFAPFAYPGASGSERDPYASVMEELKSTISEDSKDRLATERFIGEKTGEGTIEDIRAGMEPNENPDVIPVKPDPDRITGYAKRVAAGHAEMEPSEKLRAAMQGLSIQQFGEEEPELTTSHLGDVSKSALLKATGSAPAMATFPTQQRSLEALHSSPEAEAEEYGEPPPPPEEPVVAQLTEEQERPVASALREPVSSKPNPSDKYSVGMTPSKAFVKATYPEAGKARLDKLRDNMLKLKVRKYKEPDEPYGLGEKEVKFKENPKAGIQGKQTPGELKESGKGTRRDKDRKPKAVKKLRDPKPPIHSPEWRDYLTSKESFEKIDQEPTPKGKRKAYDPDKVKRYSGEGE